MKAERRNSSSGFTLVELIVVLVILAILAALLVPALTGYIDKANRQKYIAECRSLVVAAQTLASQEYGRGTFAGDSFPDDTQKAEIFTLAEIDPTAPHDISVDFDNIAAITKLIYQATDNIYVLYDPSAAEVYSVHDGNGVTAAGAPTVIKDWQKVIGAILNDNTITKKDTSTFNKAIKDANNGAYPTLDDSEKALLNTIYKDAGVVVTNLDGLVWHAIQMEGTEDGFVMIATSPANDDNTINCSYVYYNGNYYGYIMPTPWANTAYKSGSGSTLGKDKLSLLEKAPTLAEAIDNKVSSTVLVKLT